MGGSSYDLGDFGTPPPGRDILAGGGTDPGPGPGRARGALRRVAAFRAIAPVAAALSVLLFSSAGVVAYRQLSGGGPQPERYAPATAFAFVKVDLDPPAGEKIAAYRFAKKFHGSLTDKLDNADDLRDRLLRQLFEDSSDPAVDYDKDVKPWVGARVGVAGFTTADAKPHPLGVVAVHDKDKARAALARIKADAGGSFAYRLIDDYVLISDTDAAVGEAVGKSKASNLASSAHFRSDTGALGGGQLVLAWADLPRVEKALSTSLGFPSLLSPFSVLGLAPFATAIGGRASVNSEPLIVAPPSTACQAEIEHAVQSPPPPGGSVLDGLSPRCRLELLHPSTSPSPRPAGRALSDALTANHSGDTPLRSEATPLSGRIAAGVHVSSSHVDLRVRGVGTDKPGGVAKHYVGVRDLVTTLPADTVGALAFGGLDGVRDDAALSGSADSPSAADTVDLLLRPLGITFADLTGALGNSAVVVLGNVPGGDVSPLVGVKTRPHSTAGARTTVDKLRRGSGLALTYRDLGGGLVAVATDEDYAARLGEAGGLGAAKRFRSAVPDVAGTAVLVGYVDLRRVLEAQPDHGGTARPLVALGVALGVEGDVTDMRLRLVAS